MRPNEIQLSSIEEQIVCAIEREIMSETREKLIVDFDEIEADGVYVVGRVKIVNEIGTYYKPATRLCPAVNDAWLEGVNVYDYDYDAYDSESEEKIDYAINWQAIEEYLNLDLVAA